ncbi:MAG: glycoside hydrolase family 3 C-terminal domain-containing protein [Propionibacteriales bacterium]|nr:glycoside hydrolase family 3 C-terminal domain-containing protein [Propionibacteriales bacterium]
MMVLVAGSTGAVGAKVAGPEESRDDREVHRLVAQMTVEEKLSFVYWNYNLDDPLEKLWLPGVPRLGIPQLSGTDGPAGVTISRPAVAMPAPVALASTFDEDLARRYGEVLGREGRAARQDVILGPMVNNIRVPQAGRNFETFSEDPLLTGRIAASQVRGVQSQGLMTSVKHFAANTQETDRYTTDVDIDERTLREVELPGFEAPIRAGASSVMCAYPKVNGTFACGNDTLLNEILREQWGFEGWVMSDWGATHATEDIEAGLDQEMGVDVNPDGSLAPGKFFGDALRRAIEEGRIPESRLDTSVTRILRQMERFGLLDAEPPTRPQRDVAGGVAVAQEVAEEGAVLLRNEDSLLPLDPDADQEIAVIGPTAKEPKVTGLGSSYVEPDFANAPLDAMRDRAPASQLSYQVGEELRGTAIGPDALQPTFESGRKTPDANGVLYEGTLTVPETGDYRIAVRMDGGNGGLVVDGGAPIGVGDVFGPLTSVPLRLDAGEHSIQLTGTAPPGGDPTVDVDLTWVTPGAARQAQDAAVEAARGADVAVVFGYDDGAETADRTSLALPGRQDELIEAVARANPRTVVVLNTGSSVTMPWLDSTRAVLDMWYPGQAGAEATAALLFGDAEPGGRLTQTFPRSIEETPVGSDPRRFPGVAGTVHYDEGIFSGYRWYDKEDVQPLFAFGHGLSYTSFRYGPLTVRPARDGGLVARVKVTNTGDRAGSEVVQAYLGPSPEVELPQAERQLAGFEKVRLRAGESRWVVVRIAPRALQHWDVDRDTWVTGTGRRTVEVGASSRDLRRGVDVTVRTQGR